MKVCALSDLHGDLLPIDVFEPCELVCICGDISPLNIQGNYEKMRNWLKNTFKPWCEALPCDKVVFIAGNHDWLPYYEQGFMYSTFPSDSKVEYLCDDFIEYTSKEGKTYTIYGTPWCKQFYNWAFMESNEKLEELYSRIPEGLDILITHDQPFQYGDILMDNVPWNAGEHIGNKPLLQAILDKQPKLQMNGHLHSCDHSMININNTIHYNVSIKNERYYSVYEPTIIEI